MPVDMTAGATAVRNINLGNIGKDPRQLARISSSMSKLRFFGKAWNVGDQATVFYPFKYYPDESGNGGTFEMLLAAYLGHNVSNPKLLGTSFIRSLSEITIDGEVIGNGDLAYQFSQIAPLLVTAAKEKELSDLNKKDWSIVGQSAFQTARKQIEDKYDAKNNMNAEKPLLSRLLVYMLTETLYIQMDTSANAPNLGDGGKDTTTGRYIQRIANDRHAKLRKLANDPTYGILAQNPGLVPQEGEVYFLEVLYNFTSSNNSKNEAGRADPQGISETLTLAKRFPDKAAAIQNLLNGMPKNEDTISGHTWGLTPIDEDTLRKKLQTVMFNSADHLGFLAPEDQERLVRNASVIDYLRIAPADAELKEKLEKALGHEIGKAPAADAPSLQTIMDAEGNPDFSKQGNRGALVSEFQQGGDPIVGPASGEDDPLASFSAGIDLSGGGMDA